MVIRSVCAAAFYCRHCGRIHVQDLPYFSGSRRLVLRCDACGSELAVIVPHGGRWLEFQVECVGCGQENNFTYSLRELRHKSLEKIYCRREHFELGYLGRRQLIEELLDFNQAEFNALHPQDGTGFLEKQQLMLEALGRLQEMAERDDIICPCGGHEVQAEMEGSSIVVECCHCGSSRTLRVEKLQDLAELGAGCELELQPLHGVTRRAGGKEKIS